MNPNYYKGAHVFVIPSTSAEFMPLIKIDAMACAVPVITEWFLGLKALLVKDILGML